MRTRDLLAALGAALLLLAPAAEAGPSTPSVPGDIAVADGHKPYLTAHAEGVQIYACAAAGDGHAWRLEAPRATLADQHGNALGRHYGGPTWEARDGSTVVGRREIGMQVEATAIDWLRLAAVSTTGGDGGDRLSGTSYIQRIDTAGGLPPLVTECDADALGARREVPYSAVYVFYKRTGG